MGPSRNTWHSPGRNSYNTHPSSSRAHDTFAPPPLAARPALFCCPVAENNPAHLPRSFVNPGRHQMNLQLQSFLNCADDANLMLERCEVSHMIEVTTRVLQTIPVASQHRPVVEQWNIPTGLNDAADTLTPPVEIDCDMSGDGDISTGTELPRTTYQSMSTRYFITQPSSSAWQMPPDSKAFRERHPQPRVFRNETDRQERYIEVPPFNTWPYTSEVVSAGHSGPPGARPWTPSCSIVMWCNKHDNFYELHTIS